jgi:hypothetical protein
MRGVRLVTVTQGDIDWNDFAGRMMYAIQQEGKNQFLHNLSQNVIRGKIQSAREGHGVANCRLETKRVQLEEALKRHPCWDRSDVVSKRSGS